MTTDKYPPLPTAAAKLHEDGYWTSVSGGPVRPKTVNFYAAEAYTADQMRAYADAATAMQSERQTQEAGAYESAVKGRQEFRLALIEARGQLGGLRDRHAQELAAYELTVSNLREQLAARVPEADFANIKKWAEDRQDPSPSECWNKGYESARAWVKMQMECAAAPQPETTDGMGIPSSCGKPLCSRVEHHPLCKMHQPQTAAQVPSDKCRTGCTAGTDEECTNRACRTACPAAQPLKERQPMTDAQFDALRQKQNGQLNFVTLREFRLIDRAVEAFHCISAAPQPAAQPELCYCDRTQIGDPNASCGDCPTRDYKHQAQPELTDAEIDAVQDEHMRTRAIIAVRAFSRAVIAAHEAKRGAK